MKYKLETIPVWDALEEQDGCLMCSLMEKAEARYIAYYLGSSVMNPETRVKVNSTGFCPVHYRALLEASKPQPMSLVAHTHLLETIESVGSPLKQLASLKNAKKAVKIVEEFASRIDKREEGCLICESMTDTCNRYAYTFVHLWGNDHEFRKTFQESAGICLHHTLPIFRMAKYVLKGDSLAAFFQGMAEQVERDLATTAEDVHWMTQMYKSENQGKEWRGCQDAQKRAIHREIGRIRTRRDRKGEGI